MMRVATFLACLTVLECVNSGMSGPRLHAQESTAAVSHANETTFAGEKWSFGYELFQMLLEERGLAMLSDLDEATTAPSETVVVMMGDLSSLNQTDWLRLQRFVVNGGTVLLASDQSHRILGFNAGPVSTSAKEHQYQGFEDCVLATDLSRSSSLTRGLKNIVLNRSGWLTIPWSGTLNWFVAARLPADCAPRRSGQQAAMVMGWPRQQGRLPNSNEASRSRGLLLMAADQSLFTNLMLWHGDNAMLAVNVAEMLCNGQRKRLLFMVDRQANVSYTQSEAMQPEAMPSQTAESPTIPPEIPPLPDQLPEDLPEPKLETMLRLANAVVREVEESNVVNEVLADRPRRVRQPFYQRAVMLLLFGIAALWLLWRLAQKNSIQPAQVASRVMQSSLQMISRQKLGTVGGSSKLYAEAAEVLARDLCQQLTGSTSAEEWKRQLTGREWLNNSVPLSPPLREELTFAVQLAVRGHSGNMTRSRFETFGRSLRELQATLRIPA
ncbi:MAG: DUF4350 domain-containing protein [Planctomycetaceae bacterium]|nr:DUF4350 domain-containing protein [Planctomycetaceae bacterium]